MKTASEIKKARLLPRETPPLARPHAALGNRIMLARERAGLTLKEASEATGIHYTQLCKYERGTHEPYASKMLKMAYAYEVSVNELFPHITEVYL